MENCRAAGIQGIACRTVPYCLLFKEWGNGDRDMTSGTMRGNGCPAEAVAEVMKDEEARQQRLAELMDKVARLDDNANSDRGRG